MTTSAFEANWFKSSYSRSGGDCVEAAHLDGGSVAVRDSKLDKDSPVLTTSLRAGRFDRP